MSFNRWREYEDGKLTPPCVVQYDLVGKEHLIWVWTGEQIVGPLSRSTFDEKDDKAVVADAVAVATAPKAEPVEAPEVVALKVELETVKAELVTTKADLKKAQDELAAVKP